MTEDAASLESRKPYCMVCNMVGLAHCSDPLRCGQLYWPDHMYRALEEKALTQDEVTLAVLCIATTLAFYDLNPEINLDPEIIPAIRRLANKLIHGDRKEAAS